MAPVDIHVVRVEDVVVLGARHAGVPWGLGVCFFDMVYLLDGSQVADGNLIGSDADYGT